MNDLVVDVLPIAKRKAVWRDHNVLHVTLEPIKPPACKITGQVLSARGLPIADALVGFQKHLSTTSDNQGRFRLELDPSHLPGHNPPLFAAKLGMQTALIPDVIERLHASERGEIEVELRLGDAPLTIRGRVLRENGKPRTDIVVFPWRSEDLGEGLGTPEDLSLPEDAPKLTMGLGTRRAFARPDADGRFTLSGLLDREYRLRVCTEHSWLVMTTGPIRAGTQNVDIVIAKSLCGFEVAGTLQDAHGVAVPDVQVIFAYTRDKLAGGEVGGMVELGRTDAQGKYKVERVMREGSLHFRKSGWIEQRVPLARDIRKPLDVTLARACEFQLDGALSFRSIELRDAQDRVVEICNDESNLNQKREELELSGDGKTKPAFTSEHACTIVLYHADGRVERRPIRLTPGRLNLVRL